MRPKALKTHEASLDYLIEKAGAHFGAEEKDAFASTYFFTNWTELAEFVCNIGLLKSRGLVEYTRILPVPKEEAWPLLSQPERVGEWAIPVEFEPKAGGEFKFSPPEWHGVLGVFDEPQEIRFDAITGGWTSFKLTSINNQTIFSLKDFVPPQLPVPPDVKAYTNPNASDQIGGLGTHWPGLLAGWHQGVENLYNHFQGPKEDLNYLGTTNLYHLMMQDYYQK